jgi:nucleotide-binding universal stress UspA family protein
MFERILVPLDGSPLAEQALAFAQELALKFNATVTLLRATTSETEALRETITEPTLAMPEVPIAVARNLADSEYASAKDYLDRSAAVLSASGVRVESRVLEGQPEWAILKTVDDITASVVVMASHGRGGLGRLIFGSVADKVLRECSVPVLLVRAKD